MITQIILMSLLSFCQKCDTLLLPEIVDGKAELRCNNCNYGSKVEETKATLMQVNMHAVGSVKHMNRSMIYDSALKRTNTISCLNSECESLNPINWGQKNTTGRITQPSISLTNFFSEDRISTYICNTCGQTFYPKNMT